jgi:hypothetical protein
MGGMYEVRRSDGLRCHDIREEWFRLPKLDRWLFTDKQIN